MLKHDWADPGWEAEYWDDYFQEFGTDAYAKARYFDAQIQASHQAQAAPEEAIPMGEQGHEEPEDSSVDLWAEEDGPLDYIFYGILIGSMMCIIIFIAVNHFFAHP